MVPEPSVNGRVSAGQTSTLPPGCFVLDFDDYDFADDDLGMRLVEARRVCEAFAEVWYECRVAYQMPGVAVHYYMPGAGQ